jgi:hypothetical protein
MASTRRLFCFPPSPSVNANAGHIKTGSVHTEIQEMGFFKVHQGRQLEVHQLSHTEAAATSERERGIHSWEEAACGEGAKGDCSSCTSASDLQTILCRW